MLKNFFKVTVRNLWRNKGFSAINIAGLAIGMAAAMLILLWIQNQLSTDRFYSKTSQLYMMYNRDKIAGELHAFGATPKILAPTLKQDFPVVEDATRFNNVT